MHSAKKVLIDIGFIAAVVAFRFVPEAIVQAQGNANASTKGVVVNTPLIPVPVTGQLAVTGTTTIAGHVHASQHGSWSVGQSCPWTVKIAPTQNAVAVASTPAFFHDTGFGVMNGGGVVELGMSDDVCAPGPDSVAQAFVVGERPASGDLRLVTRLETELTRYDDASGLSYANPFGSVRHGRALVRDTD